MFDKEENMPSNTPGYYIRLNDDHTVDRNTVISIYYNGYYYQNE